MSEAKISQENFRGLAFPAVKVKYAGPTDTRGSRWIAQLGRIYRTTLPYRSELSSGSDNALPAAQACIAKAFRESGDDVADYVAIPASLDSDTYVFTFVPRYFFDRYES